jgi:hypothetical protein
LSRRRTQFRGPPPSFYRAGGWGTQGTKRADASSSSSSQSHSQDHTQQQREQQQHYTDPANSAYPFASSDPNDVPHFDRETHHRTHSTIESQLRTNRQRRRQAQAEARRQQGQTLGFDEGEMARHGESSAGDVLGSFLVVSGILAVGVGGAVLFVGQRGVPREKKSGR